MKKHLAVLLIVLAFALGAIGCGIETPEEEAAAVNVELQALEGSCSFAGTQPTVSRYRIKVVDLNENPPATLADEEFEGVSGTVTIGDIPESNDVEVTLLGFPTGVEQPAVYARSKSLVISKNETTQVKTTLVRFADYSCANTPTGAANLVFPSATRLPDGRVLIAGGMTRAAEESGRYEVSGASDRGFVFDPEPGELRQTANLMNKGRGAHAAIYMPKQQLVLLVGGTERLYREKQSSKFPWYFLKDKSGDVGYSYELFDIKTERFLTYEGEEWPDEGHTMIKNVRRVFPTVSLNNDGTVLVTGGGLWPSAQTKAESDSDYRVAELYRPASESYTGGFMDSHGALTMRALRSGHTGVLLEVKDKLSHHLFWGGNQDGPVAEIYQESTGQMDGNFGSFKEVSFLDASSYTKKPFFHTMTPLLDRQFLLVGGVNYSQGNLKVPSAGDAYLVDVRTDQKVGVTQLDGLEKGRYFHSAVTYDNDHVVVTGGFSSVVAGEDTLFDEVSTEDMRFFDLGAGKFYLPPVDDAPMKKAGLASAGLNNDCLLLVGGVDTPADGLEFKSSPKSLVAEVFCPSMICPEGLWSTGCYVE